MKRIHRIMIASAAMAAIPGMASAQSAIDAYQISQQDLRGTARFMSMGGAFGALGGDLSTLSQNPAGIGVYRNNEIGFTLDLQANEAKSSGRDFSDVKNQTFFNLNNIGGVAAISLNSKTVPYVNLGFTYNRAVSFNRKYRGGIPNLPISLSNYIAGIANNYQLTQKDVVATDSYDPYGYGSNVPWITVLGYESYLIDPEGNPDKPWWYGQFGNGTSGSGAFSVNEKGYVDEYNIAVGGNINDIVYWGMNFDIVNMDYRVSSTWEESLQDAYVYNPDTERVDQMDSNWRLRDLYKVYGTGFNYQLGVIVKPIQELRLGLAFHTPTYYNLTERFYCERVDFDYPFRNGRGSAETNYGDPSENDIDFASPWKIIASAAGVIGNKLIISADYEWNCYKHMKYRNPSYDDYYDPWDPWYDDDWVWWGAPTKKSPSFEGSYDNDPIAYTNSMIREIYKNTSTFRIGAEYRVIPQFSIRLGYNYTSSPVTSKVKQNMVNIPASGTITSYRLDNDTNYITAGIGYRSHGFYADLAYVYKHQTAEYYPFSPDPEEPLSAANSKLTFNNSQIALSIGYKF